MNAVQQEDCSAHEVHGRRSCDHRSLSKCVEQSKDGTGLITDDDDRCKLTAAYSTSARTEEPCRGDTWTSERLSWMWSAVEPVASGDGAGPAYGSDSQTVRLRLLSVCFAGIWKWAGCDQC